MAPTKTAHAKRTDEIRHQSVNQLGLNLKIMNSAGANEALGSIRAVIPLNSLVKARMLGVRRTRSPEPAARRLL